MSNSLIEAIVSGIVGALTTELIIILKEFINCCLAPSRDS